MSNPLTAKINQADALAQQACEIMWLGFCCKCRRRKPGSGHHLHGRTRRDVRWQLMNLVYLCTECHSAVTDNAYQKSRFDNYLRKNWPGLWEWHEAHMIPEEMMWFDSDMDEVIKGLKDWIVSQDRIPGECNDSA